MPRGMDLEKKIADFLARADPKPTRSKLEPYDELIRTLRQRRWTFKMIAEVLNAEFGLKVNPKTVWDYLQVHRGVQKVMNPTHASQDNSVRLSTPKRRFNLDA